MGFNLELIESNERHNDNGHSQNSLYTLFVISSVLVGQPQYAYDFPDLSLTVTTDSIVLSIL